ncbi:MULTISPECIES: barstar family protein [Stenotrophomonas]|jgi:RNAse (barnase) inhibitor barstar|uniref:Barstar family protein n=1 Tax=Stenotrophomonas aracearum TaxID=3003272 RepID=A0ABY9Y9Z5_9GAMM|nr:MULTISPECIES: barstar family protein [unclassified Stenotrophomonas]WNH47476.1 barstar family protein [Stenotrophomonas sp. A5588]
MNHDAFELGLDDINNAGVYAIGNDDIGPLSAAMRDAGLRVATIDLAGCHDKRTLLTRMATQLDFPRTFGGNWDALLDCLRDLSWLKANGYALFFSDADGLRGDAEKDFDTLLDVLDEACQAWAEQNVPFWAFLAVTEA